MRTGITLRQWLLGLTAALGCPWRARQRPAAASRAGPAAGPPFTACPAVVSPEALGMATTYTYGAGGPSITTIAYCGSGASRGPRPE